MFDFILIGVGEVGEVMWFEEMNHQDIGVRFGRRWIVMVLRIEFNVGVL